GVSVAVAQHEGVTLDAQPVKTPGRGGRRGDDPQELDPGAVGEAVELKLVDRASEHLGGGKPALPDRTARALLTDPGIDGIIRRAYQRCVNIAGGTDATERHCGA